MIQLMTGKLIMFLACHTFSVNVYNKHIPIQDRITSHLPTGDGVWHTREFVSRQNFWVL